MPNKSGRPAWERDAEQEAPISYRLPSSHKKAKAGCWLVLLLILLSLALLGCGLAKGVRKFAEPIDTAGCEADCRIVGLHMSRYEYETDACWCALEDGGEIKAHEFLPAVKGGGE